MPKTHKVRPTTLNRKQPKNKDKGQVIQMDISSQKKRKLSDSEGADEVANRQSPTPGLEDEAGDDPVVKTAITSKIRGKAISGKASRNEHGSGKKPKTVLVPPKKTSSDVDDDQMTESSNIAAEASGTLVTKASATETGQPSKRPRLAATGEIQTSGNVSSSAAETSSASSTPVIPDFLQQKNLQDWSTNDVFTFLNANKNPQFGDEHIKVIQDQEIAGIAFLELTDQRLIAQFNLKIGPAIGIQKLIGNLKVAKGLVSDSAPQAPQAVPQAFRDDSFSLDGLNDFRTPKDILYDFLAGHNGNFLTLYLTRNDPLPSYESNSPRQSHNKPATAFAGRPSLLLHNLPEDSTSVSTTATAALDAMRREGTADNLLIMLGTSGCGKTRTCFEILCGTWGIYFVAGKEFLGSKDIALMESYLTPLMTGNFDNNRSHAEHYTKCALLARLLILDHCVTKSPSFTPQRWMLIQVVQDIFQKMYDYYGDIFSNLTVRLARACNEQVVRVEIRNTYTKLYKKLELNVFPIFLDEAQVLQHILPNHFKSRTVATEDRPLLSPVVHALVQPIDFVYGHCVVPCGTGLGLMFVRETLLSGVAKQVNTISRFTNFGGWRDEEHVAQYARAIVNLEYADITKLYQYFPGRFRPIVTCIEKILTGFSVSQAIDFIWDIVTTPRTLKEENRQSLYYQLDGVMAGRRPNFVNSTSVLELFKSVALSHFYAGSSHIFINSTQMEIVELGLARLKTLPIAKVDNLKENLSLALGREIDEDTLMESVAEEKPAASFTDGLTKLVAFVDEPMVLAALYNFFVQRKALSQEILTLMAASKDPSAQGTLWQRYLPEEFGAMFDGSKIVAKLPFLNKIKNLPKIYRQTATIIRSSSPIVPVVKIASVDYKLEDYMTDDSNTRAAFFIPENLAGPDLTFFIKFRDGNIVPVFVQVRLRSAVHGLEAALGTTDPRLFYRDSNGKLHNEDRNGPVVKKVLDLCKNGVLRILVYYPAEVSQAPHVRKYREPLARVTTEWDVVGIISKKNEHEVFSKEHIKFLDALKTVSATAKRKYEELEYPRDK